MKLEVPGTVKAAVWVIAPPAVMLKLPPLFRVMAGSAMAVFVKSRVKLRKLVNPVRLGTVAEELVFSILTSRILLVVPAKERVLAKLLAAVPKLISELGAVTLKLVVPGTVKAPVCVIAPPAVMVRLPLLVSVTDGNATAALVKSRVKLRKLVNPVKLGTVAEELIFSILTSWI